MQPDHTYGLNGNTTGVIGQRLVDLLHQNESSILDNWLSLTEHLAEGPFQFIGDEEIKNVYRDVLRTVSAVLQSIPGAIDTFLSAPSFRQFRHTRDPLEVIQIFHMSKYALQPVIVESVDAEVSAALKLADLYNHVIENIIEKFRSQRLYSGQENEALETFQNLMDFLLRMFNEKALSLDVDALLTFIADELMEAIFSIDCLAYRYDAQQNLLVLKTRGIHFTNLSSEMHQRVRLPLDPQNDAFVREILEKKTIVLSNNAQTDPRTNRDIARVMSMEGFIGIPLVVNGHVEAVLMVCTFAGDPPFSDEQIALLENLSKTASVMLENILLQEESRRRMAENQGIERITSALIQELDSQSVLKMVCAEAQNLTRARRSAVYFLREEDEILSLVFYTGEKPGTDAIPLYSSLGGDAIRENQVIYVNDKENDSRMFYKNTNFSNLLIAPLITQGMTIGVMYLLDKCEDFTDSEARIIRIFADQATVAIENARLRERLQRMAILEERERLARELHDNVAQILSALKLQVSFSKELLQQGNFEQALSSLVDLNRAASEANSEIRDAIFSLRTNASSTQELLPALSAYLDRFRNTYEIEVELIASEAEILPLNADAVVQIPRIIQEALTNVRKHALASYIKVEFTQLEDILQISIIDNGCGFDPGSIPRVNHEGVGLLMMRERAAEIGGVLEISSKPGQGSQVIIRVPTVSKG